MKIWAKRQRQWFYWVKISGKWICKKVAGHGYKSSEYLAGLGENKDDAFMNMLARNKELSAMISTIPPKTEFL